MAERLGCIGTIMLAGFIGLPLAALGVPDQWAFGTALAVVIVGWPTLYAYQRTRQQRRQALTQPPQPSPAPGWYPDPTGDHGVRYWDGIQWTSRVTDHPR